VVFGRSTFPALSRGGNPVAPVTASAGRHVRFRMSPASPASTGSAPETNGNLAKTALPSTCAAALACSTRASGISTWSSSATTRPLTSSSIRERRERAIRNVSGTMPLASPECTPSRRISTLSDADTMPRKDVVLQRRS
jgi:hypothetical protein